MAQQTKQLIDYAGGSDIGLVRERNEDSILMYQFDHCDVSLFVVADGVGGHKGGDVASRLAVDTIHSVVSKAVLQANSGGGYGENWLDMILRHAIVEANLQILQQQADPTLENMATTVVCALLKSNHLALGHLGDSRAYLFEDSSLKQLTDDHTMLRDMLKQGEINQDLYESMPMHNLISRALGLTKDIELEINHYSLLDNQTVMLCTDGLTNCLEDMEIQQVLSESHNLQDCVDTLITGSNDHGGSDNITLVLFRPANQAD